MADTLGVNRSTARGIVARYITEERIRERQRGSRNNVLVDDEMRQCLEDIINEGERAYRQVCGQRGRNVTVALAVGNLRYDTTVSKYGWTSTRNLGREIVRMTEYPSITVASLRR